MVRSNDFYFKRYGFDQNYVSQIHKVINDIKQDIYDEDFIINNGENILKVCICEAEYDIFRKLISPVPFKNGGKTNYKYLIDFFSLETSGFLREFPASIMEEWAKVNKSAKMDASYSGEEFVQIPVEDVAEDIVVLPEMEKKAIYETAFDIDYKKIKDTKIKDVFARLVGATSCFVDSKEDVIRYVEIPFVFPAMMLFDKNILMTSNDTACCFNDEGMKEGVSNILIDYASLDESNKLVVDLLIVKGFAEVSGDKIMLKVYTTSEDTVERVCSEMMQIVDCFNYQDNLYMAKTREQLLEEASMVFMIFGISQDKLEEMTSSLSDGEELMSFLRQYGLENSTYYDSESGLYWPTKNTYVRHTNYLARNTDKSISI